MFPKFIRILFKPKMLVIASILVVINLSIPYFIHRNVSSQISHSLEKIEKAEFGIVLGAAIQADGQPSNFLKKRLDDAILLYKNGKVNKLLLSGDNSRTTYDEISVMNNYLVRNGIPQNKLFGDYAGFDTYSTMARADSLFQIKNVIVISQPFHLARAVYISEQKGMQSQGFATKPNLGGKYNHFREWMATIKSFYDCAFNRKPKFYGEQINTANGSNVILQQLNH